MRYVAAFASSATLEAFRLPEFLSVAATLHIPVTLLDADIPWVSQGGGTVWFSVFESPACTEQLTRLAARCMLLRGIYLLFETTPTVEDLYACLDARIGDATASSGTAPAAAATFKAFTGGMEELSELGSSSTYAYQVETIGKKYTGDAKRELLDEVVRRVQPQGTVEWRTPDRSYYIFLQHAIETAPAGTHAWVPNGPLLRVFHCRLVVESGRCAMLATYDLKRRPYIGTTSMPPEESMVMANMSHICPGHFACDPFCGTGSLLVAAAHCGAMTFGADADGRAMRAGTEKGKTSPQLQQQRQLALATYPDERLAMLTDEERVLPTMWTNFKVYGLPPPDRARMNFSAWENAWHTTTGTAAIFDAVLSDPPYGLREPRRKVETTTDADSTATTTHVLSAYMTNEVVLDLVLFAATHLALGGRLTFWHPTTDHYCDDELPTHPSLCVRHNIPQRVSLKIVRRLIVMEKVSPVPSPPPSRESCAARRAPEDLRSLMDATAMPDNADYTQYRARKDRKRQATRHFLQSTAASTPSAEEGEGEGERRSGGNRRGRKGNRIDGQERIVANRQKNIAAREAKQVASHLANAAHKTARSDST